MDNPNFEEFEGPFLFDENESDLGYYSDDS